MTTMLARMSDTSARRPPWRRPIPLVLGFVVLSLAIWGAAWYTSDADLERVRARAEAEGLALSWEGFGLPAADASQRAAWARIEALVGDGAPIQAYARSASTTGEEPDPSVIGRPLPPALRDHHARLDADQVAELLAAVDALGAEPMALQDDYDFDSDLSELTTIREVLAVLSERILLAPDAPTAAAEAVRALRFADIQPDANIVMGLIKTGSVAAVDRAIAFRLEELTAHRHTDLEAALARRSRDAYARLRRLFAGELVAQYRLLVDLSEGRLDDLELPTGGGFTVRLAREHPLQSLIDVIEIIDRHTSLSAVLPELEDHQTSVETQLHDVDIWDRMALSLTGLLYPHPRLVGGGFARGPVTARLLLAELRDQPWPIDPTDPNGQPVRPIERDGRIIAGYLLKDGVDDGGDPEDDWIIELYESPATMVAENGSGSAGPGDALETPSP